MFPKCSENLKSHTLLLHALEHAAFDPLWILFIVSYSSCNSLSILKLISRSCHDYIMNSLTKLNENGGGDNV